MVVMSSIVPGAVLGGASFLEARSPSATDLEASAVAAGVSRFGSLENRMFSTAAPMDGFTAVPKRDIPAATAHC